MVFEVTQSLTITTNGFQTSIKTKFDVEFLVLEKSGERRIYGIRKAKVATIPISDNNYLQIAEELEWQTYPIEIETDLEGNFIKMLNHKKWLKNLEQVTQSVIEEFDNSENVKEIRNKYLQVAKNEENFIQSKFKEPYWNLLFFNPPIDHENNPDIGTKLNWDIKSVGNIECMGRTKIKNPTSRDIIINFESKQSLPQNVIDQMEANIKLLNVDWESQKVNLEVSATFDTMEKRMKSKKALFEFQILGIFSYVEETTINFRRKDVEPV